MCIIDHYPLGNQKTEISGGLKISDKLGRDSRCLNPDFLILPLAALPLCYCTVRRAKYAVIWLLKPQILIFCHESFFIK